MVLKFPQIREAFTSLQLCFNEFDKNNDGTMDHSELREAMSRLTGVEMPQDEADELFRSGDLYEEGRISFQEFIVCLAIGYVLKTVIVKNIPEAGGKTSEGAGGFGVVCENQEHYETGQSVRYYRTKTQGSKL